MIRRNAAAAELRDLRDRRMKTADEIKEARSEIQRMMTECNRLEAECAQRESENASIQKREDELMDELNSIEKEQSPWSPVLPDASDSLETAGRAETDVNLQLSRIFGATSAYDGSRTDAPCSSGIPPTGKWGQPHAFGLPGFVVSTAEQLARKFPVGYVPGVPSVEGTVKADTDGTSAFGGQGPSYAGTNGNAQQKRVGPKRRPGDKKLQGITIDELRQHAAHLSQWWDKASGRFQCPACSAMTAGAKKEKVVRHLLEHLHDKSVLPFKCFVPGCNFANARSDKMQRHATAVHKFPWSELMKAQCTVPANKHLLDSLFK